MARQISYFAPQQWYGEVRETNLEGIFEFIQVVYYDTASPWQRLVLHPLAVTWRAAEPRCRAPFDSHSTSNLGFRQRQTQKVYPYWLRLMLLRKYVVVWCHFERAPSFPAHNFFYWSHTDSWLVTNKTIVPHPPLFLGLSYSYVCTNTDIDVMFRGITMCSSAFCPPSSASSLLPLICCHNARPGESRTYTTTPTMSNCYHGLSSDRFHH